MMYRSDKELLNMQIENCNSCGAVFVDPVRKICKDCYDAEEKAFQTVYRFITNKANREATIAEIVRATDVEESLIIKFMKENRLRASQFPKLFYPCENCGVDIGEGRWCGGCTKELQKEFQIYQNVKRIKREINDNQNPVYYAINKDRQNRR